MVDESERELSERLRACSRTGECPGRSSGRKEDEGEWTMDER
jgi:hypothetical protein